jgi:hypothetical protein
MAANDDEDDVLLMAIITIDSGTFSRRECFWVNN